MLNIRHETLKTRRKHSLFANNLLFTKYIHTAMRVPVDNAQKEYEPSKIISEISSTTTKKVFPFYRLTILLTQAKCATSEKLAFVYDTVKHGIQYFAIKRDKENRFYRSPIVSYCLFVPYVSGS
jgi:hypothetical protein